MIERQLGGGRSRGGAALIRIGMLAPIERANLLIPSGGVLPDLLHELQAFRLCDLQGCVEQGNGLLLLVQPVAGLALYDGSGPAVTAERYWQVTASSRDAAP